MDTTNNKKILGHVHICENCLGIPYFIQEFTFNITIVKVKLLKINMLNY